MSRFHLVRVGALGHVGRFTAVDAVRYPRGCRVVLRTDRGLELGEILGSPGERELPGHADGVILRGVTGADALLERRLLQRRDEAFARCAQRVAELGIAATLMEAELLFDGQTLVFHFLGACPPELNAVLAELAATYEQQIQLQRFGTALEEGCGPGCGTAGVAGQGCGSCATGGCSLASACRPKSPAQV